MTVASDNFNRADGALGANWHGESPDAAMAIVSQQAVGVSAVSPNSGYWSADSFGADQFSQATITVHPASGKWVGVTVRALADGTEYLLIAFNNSGTDSWLLFKRTGGGSSFAQIGSTVVTPIVVSQVMRLEVEGTTVTAKIDGTAIITQTDSDIASGAPGISNSGVADPANGALDNWSGGDVTADVFVPVILEYA
jgi:hypothetical protein